MIVIVLLCCEIDFQVARLQFCGVLFEAGNVLTYIDKKDCLCFCVVFFGGIVEVWL